MSSPTRNVRALLAALAALGGLSSLATAQSVATVPVGAITYSVPAGATRAITVPLLESSSGQGQVRGIITGVVSNKITNTNAGWAAGAFSSASSPHYVRILTGTAQGRIFLIATTPNTATEITVTNDGTDLTTLGISAGTDQYEILPSDTLLSLFGNDALQGGVSADVADNVLVWNTSSYLKFYYNSTRSRWERDIDTAASPTRDTFVLRPDRGIMIQRKAATALSLTITGTVQDRAFKAVHATNGTTFLNYGFPTAVTLTNLKFHQLPGWKSWNDQLTASANADLIQVWNNTSWLSFYYDSTQSRWQRAGVTDNTDRNNFSVAACVPVVVKRITGASSNVVGFDLPYSL